MVMNVKAVRLVTLVGVGLTFSLFCLEQSKSTQSRDINRNKVRGRSIDVYNDGNAPDTASPPALSHFTAKTRFSKPAEQPLSVSRPTLAQEPRQSRVNETYGKLPLSFEA